MKKNLCISGLVIYLMLSVSLSHVFGTEFFDNFDTLNMTEINITADAQQPVTVTFPDFSDLSDFTLNGVTADINSEGTVFSNGQHVLRLTDELDQGGSAFLTNPIALDNDASFSSAFQFQITDPQGISDEDGQGADGIVFVVQTQSNNVGASGGSIGYGGINPSVGIEFDTWNNGSDDGNNGNHVGINLNGNLDSVALHNVDTRMNNGEVWYAWVDYDGVADLLEVRLSETPVRPDDAVLSYTVDLVTVLGTPNTFVGFTSGTGGGGGDHDIRAWQFTSSYNPIEELLHPSMTVTPYPIDFGNVIVGVAKPLTVSIGNTGNADLNVTDITSDLGEILHFVQDDITIAPEATHELTLTLTASTAGEIAGRLTITSNDPNSPTEIDISATVQAPPPTITEISLGSGPTFGGTGITITGENFVDGATVMIGGKPATDVVVVSVTEINAKTPAGYEGSADLIVANPDGQSGALKGGFIYITPLVWSFTLSLKARLNMIHLALRPETPITAKDFAEMLEATLVIRYDTDQRQFTAYIPSDAKGFPIEGGKGYIVNVLEDKEIEITGQPWGEPITEVPAVGAFNPDFASEDVPESVWAFVVSGTLLHRLDSLHHAIQPEKVIVKNLRSGATATTMPEDGTFQAIFVDPSRSPVVSLGDTLEVVALDANGERVSGPFRWEVKLQDLRVAYLQTQMPLGDVIPDHTRLLANYPNPFNPETWIPYELSESAEVTLSIYDVSGRLVRQLWLGQKPAGMYVDRSRVIYWDGRNDAGERVGSGTYFYLLKTDHFTAARKMVVLK